MSKNHQNRSRLQLQNCQNIPRECSLSRSRYGSYVRIQSENEYVRENRHKSEERVKCVACWCEDCKRRRYKVDYVVVNLVHEDLVVNLCDNYVVENTQGGENLII